MLVGPGKLSPLPRPAVGDGPDSIVLGAVQGLCADMRHCSRHRRRRRTSTMLYWPLLLLLSTGGVRGDDDDVSNARDLELELLKDYMDDRRPVRDHNKGVTVTVQMILEYLFIDDVSDLITVNCWLVTTWKDEYLTWSPADYGGVELLQLDNYKIWSPIPFIYDTDITYKGLHAYYMQICNVKSNGTVVCIPHVSHTALCAPDPTRWPYDVQNCTLQFASWTHTADQLNFVLAEKPILLNYYQDNREWAVASTSAWRNSEEISILSKSYPSINFSFLLKRRNAIHTAIVIIPAIAMVLLTIASDLLAPGGLRISVAMMSLLAQIVYIIEISHSIPSHADFPANIIKFFRDSIIMTTLTLLVSMMVMSLTKFTRPPPRLLTVVVNITRTGPVRYVTFGDFDADYHKPIVEEEEADTESNKLVQERTANREWKKFSTIFSNIFFIITTFVYITLILLYVF